MKALQLLKILDRKQISGQMLLDTKIGKKLAIISCIPNPENPDSDAQKMRELKEMKEYLKKKWQTVYNSYKKVKELKKVEPEVEEEKAPEKFTIPYIPNEVENDDEGRNM